MSQHVTRGNKGKDKMRENLDEVIRDPMKYIYENNFLRQKK